MKSKSLKQKATAGFVWTAVQKYSTMGISFISGIILARLLTPSDYGCIGMLAIFMAVAEAFIDGGFGSALIQKKSPTQEDYSTIFFWNIGVSMLMYVILYISAPYIAEFYNIPLLCDVLRVMGVILFIYAFNIVQRNLLRKTLNFKTISIVSITTSLISLSVTIYLAYSGFGVWALVVQKIISAALPAIIYWFYIKWRPTFVFSWKSFRELFGFGFYMFMTHFVNSIGSHVQGLVIGKIYNPTTLGYYSKAVSTESLASQSITSVLTQVTYPLFAEVQDDKQRLGNMIKRLTMAIAFITFPMLYILMLLAEPIFILLYSERWINSIPYFQALCFVGMVTCVQAVNLQSIAAVGKSKAMFIWAMVKRGVGLAFIISGLLLYGMKGLIIGLFLQNLFGYFVNAGLVSKYIGYKWIRQIMDIIPTAVIATLAAVIAYTIGIICGQQLYIDAIIKLLSFCVIYFLWVFLRKPESYVYFLSVIPDRFQFWNKRRR